MASAPKVQSLSQIMTELAPASAQQTSLIQQQQAGLGAKYAEQQKGLDAQKAADFTTINNQATGRGMAFSGIPLDEQATYLSTNYLPAIANLKQQQNDENMSLSKNLADIYSQQYTSAFNTRQTQQGALNSWNMQQMQLEAQAREAEKQRKFEAEQNAANRAASAANAAASAASKQTSPWQLGGSAGGGYTVFNSDGSRANIDLWTYVRGNGGSQQDLVNLLANGDKNDRKAASNYAQNVSKYGQAAAFAQLQKDASTAFYTSK